MISEAHEGLKQTIGKVAGMIRQRWRAHFWRNAPANVPWHQYEMVATVVRGAFLQEDEAQARAHWRETVEKLRERFSRLAAPKEDAEHDMLAFTGFTKGHWPKLASKNPLERLVNEIKRRSRMVGDLPDQCRHCAAGRYAAHRADR